MAAEADQEAVRVEAPAASDPAPDLAPDGRPRPASVAIVAMGASHQEFVHGTAFLGGGRALGDEVWAVNAMAGVIQHDRAFIMDPPSHFFDEATLEKATSLRRYREWLAVHPGPVYSVETDERFPGVVEYPLEAVLRTLGFTYLNTTVAYALAYAIWLQVPQIRLFGCDFTYADAHIAESGRGCCEFLIAVAIAMGLDVQVAKSSTLMDACVPVDQRLYAYTRARRRPIVRPATADAPLTVEWVENG